MTSSLQLLYVTCTDRAQAEEIASFLLQQELIACANILGGVRSLFRWQGEVQCSDEVLLLAKTQQRHIEVITEHICRLHSYECPCIVAFDVANGYPPFLQWVMQETMPKEAN